MYLCLTVKEIQNDGAEEIYYRENLLALQSKQFKHWLCFVYCIDLIRQIESSVSLKDKRNIFVSGRRMVFCSFLWSQFLMILNWMPSLRF